MKENDYTKWQNIKIMVDLKEKIILALDWEKHNAKHAWALFHHVGNPRNDWPLVL